MTTTPFGHRSSRRYRARRRAPSLGSGPCEVIGRLRFDLLSVAVEIEDGALERRHGGAVFGIGHDGAYAGVPQLTLEPSRWMFWIERDVCRAGFQDPEDGLRAGRSSAPRRGRPSPRRQRRGR